jgi:hypothetical protein
MAEELFVFSPEVRAEMVVTLEAFTEVIAKYTKAERCGNGGGATI